MRINKFIAGNSKYSRRQVDKLIEEGKIYVNGTKITEVGINIDTEKDKVKVNKEDIKQKAYKIYIALNKPVGYITTRNDEKNRETVMDLVKDFPDIKPAGRLDKDTEGLLLLSNDGNFIYRLTHPKHETKKTYFAITKGKLAEETKKKLEEGVEIEGKKTAPSKIKIKRRTEKETHLIITIHEGRNRQIRKMFALLNHHVKYLKRLSVGDIKLNRLKTGQYRHLTQTEINDSKFN